LEYTILLSLVALVVVGAMTALGRQINNTLPEGVPTEATAPPPPPVTTTSSSSTTSTTSTTTTTAP
jgi:hypothetical protein